MPLQPSYREKSVASSLHRSVFGTIVRLIQLGSPGQLHKARAVVLEDTPVEERRYVGPKKQLGTVQPEVHGAIGMIRLVVFSAALLCAAQAWAQGSGYGFLPSPAGTEIVRCENATAGGNQACYLSQMRDARGYQKVVPTAGQTVTIGNNVSRLILNPAGTLATLTIKTPVTPYDGQEICIFSTQAVTALTSTASGSQTWNSAPSALTANAAASCWVYSLSNTTWDRSE